MPHVSFVRDIPKCKAAAVKYSISGNEDIHLCYSLECKHGPGINRDGKRPPWMPFFYHPWDTTTDPILQRLGTWFINKKLKQKFLSGLPPHLDELLSSGLLSEVEKNKILHQFNNTPNYLDYFFRGSELGKEIIGLQSFGNLTMNLWNVAWVDLRLLTSDPKQGPELLFLGAERIDSRIYTCLVKWKEDAKDAPARPATGKKLRVSIEDLRFVRFAFDANPSDPEVVKLIRLNTGIADQIEFAVSGQLLIRDGKLIKPREIVTQFSDMRHLLTLPNLNPKGPLFRPKNKPLDKGRPRYYFGYEQTDDIWFGEVQLLEDRNLRRAALNGSVELSRLYGGLGASEDQVKSALNYRTVRNQNGKPVSERFYKEGPSPPTSLKKGQWRFVMDDPSLVEVWLKPNIYPCSILGVTEEGDIVCFAWRGNYTAKPGYTIMEAAGKVLKDYEGKNAILIDEGNDVRHECFDPEIGQWRRIVVDQSNREQVRAMFIFTD